MKIILFFPSNWRLCIFFIFIQSCHVILEEITQHLQANLQTDFENVKLHVIICNIFYF
jgi:hypothetical protein